MEVQIPYLLRSKKFVASIAAALISFFAMRDGMTVDQIALIVGPLIAYVGAQGLADIGKERVKVESKTRPPE